MTLFDVSFYLLVFLLVFFVYQFFILKKEEKTEAFKDSMEMKYLKSKYKINIEKIDLKKSIHLIALSNALIITVTLMVLQWIDHFVVKIMVAFVVLIILQLIVYYLVAKYLKRGEGK